MPGSAFVFGYGSLAILGGTALGRELRPDGFVADLKGFGRGWGVAMDNRRDLPGYKHYTDARGERPALFVSYLDVRETSGGRVNGVCLPVNAARLAELDARERNYERVDVSDRVAAGGATVWAYLGSAPGRARFAQGRDLGRAAIDAGYLRLVIAGFAALGEAEQAAAAPSLDPGVLPVVELTRVDLPTL